MLPRFLYLFFFLSFVTSLILIGVSVRSGNTYPTEPPKSKRNIKDANNITTIFNCNDKILRKNVEYHGDYVIFNNFVKPDKDHKCDESIALSTPADYRFLDNVVPLIERWNGPISIALYAPGYDFLTSLRSIAYLRKCSSASDLIRKYVSFHLFCEHDHLPNQVSPIISILRE